MSLAPAIAVRYLLGGRNRYARFIAWISLLGLALGVLVLSVVVSVMNGLGQELRSRILGTVPHVLITPATPGLAESVASLEDVHSAYPFFSSSGMVAGSGAVVPVSLFGLEPEDGVLLSQVDRNMTTGTLTDAPEPARGRCNGRSDRPAPGTGAGGLRGAHRLGTRRRLGCTRSSSAFGSPELSRSGPNSTTTWCWHGATAFPSGNGDSWVPMACA